MAGRSGASPPPSLGLSSLSLSVSVKEISQVLETAPMSSSSRPANITRFGPWYARNLQAFPFPFSLFCANTLSFSGDSAVNFGLSLRDCIVVVGQAVFWQQPCLISLRETVYPTTQLPGWLFPAFPGGQRKFFNSCTKHRVVVGSDRSMKTLQDAWSPKDVT